MKDKILKEIEWLENQIDKLYANGHDTTYFEKLIDRRIEHLEKENKNMITIDRKSTRLNSSH